MNETACVIIVCISVYALFASTMWWSKAVDCKYLDELNSNLHDMINKQFDKSRESYERITELNAKLNEAENTLRNLRDGIENLAAVAGCFNARDGE